MAGVLPPGVSARGRATTADRQSASGGAAGRGGGRDVARRKHQHDRHARATSPTPSSAPWTLVQRGRLAQRAPAARPVPRRHGGRRPRAALCVISRLVEHVQIADVPGRTPAGHRPAADRRVPGRPGRLGYAGAVGLEYRPSGGTDGRPGLAATRPARVSSGARRRDPRRPHRRARGGGWRAYYDRDWPRAHRADGAAQPGAVPHPAFRCRSSPPVHVARGSIAWAPVDNDQAAVARHLRRFYRMAARWSGHGLRAAPRGGAGDRLLDRASPPGRRLRQDILHRGHDRAAQPPLRRRPSGCASPPSGACAPTTRST